MQFHKVTLLSAFIAGVAVMFSSSFVHSAKLSESSLSKKQEGWYPTGLPLVNYSSDVGFGYGARAYLYYNGTRNDSYFDTTPYFAEIYAQFYKSTGGVSYHCLSADLPYLLGTAFRLITYVDYDLALSSNYFGDNAAHSDAGLRTLGDESFASAQDLANEYISQGTDVASLRKIHAYTRERWSWSTRLRRTWSETASITLGAYFSNATVEDWNGKEFEFEDETLVSGPTLLTKDSSSLVGLDGGWANSLSLALTYDTLDFAPDPRSGWMAEYVVEAGTTLVGSDYDYVRQTFILTGAYTLFGWWTHAARIAVTDLEGDSPFYEKGVFNQSTGRSVGVGGARTGRGFPLRRFVADTMVVAQWDNRFFLGDTMILGQRFGLQLLGFVDAGNVYDEFDNLLNKPRWHHLKVSYGGGVIIPWNLATLIHVVAGWSGEGMSFSIDFGHAF